jgi:hypothetical protein
MQWYQVREVIILQTSVSSVRFSLSNNETYLSISRIMVITRLDELRHE